MINFDSGNFYNLCLLDFKKTVRLQNLLANSNTFVEEMYGAESPLASSDFLVHQQI